MLVPNGGFDALQESLITKQLAHLIQKKPEASGGAQAAPPPQPAPRQVSSASDVPAKPGTYYYNGDQQYELLAGLTTYISYLLNSSKCSQLRCMPKQNMLIPFSG